MIYLNMAPTFKQHQSYSLSNMFPFYKICVIIGPAGVDWPLLSPRAYVVITDCHVPRVLFAHVWSPVESD